MIKFEFSISRIINDFYGLIIVLFPFFYFIVFNIIYYSFLPVEQLYILLILNSIIKNKLNTYKITFFKRESLTDFIDFTFFYYYYSLYLKMK